MKIFTVFLLLVQQSIGSIGFSQNVTFLEYKISEVGYISIPDNMEIQAGNFKKFAETYQKELGRKNGYEVSDERIVFQPKGLNSLDKIALASYARVILNTDIGNFGDYGKLTTTFTATPIELEELGEQIKSQIQQGMNGTGLKMISWYGIALSIINGKSALKISYTRQLNDHPIVVVKMYQFQNNDRMHTLTLSYRKDDESTWKPLFDKIVNSFIINNIR